MSGGLLLPKKRAFALHFTRETFVSFFFLLIVSFSTRSTQTWTASSTVYQMIHVLSYQFFDKTKQMGGKRSFHFIVNGYAQSKFHPKAPAAEYAACKRAKSDGWRLLASNRFVYPRRIRWRELKQVAYIARALQPSSLSLIHATLTSSSSTRRRWEITWNRSARDNAGSGIDSASEIQSRSLSYQLAAGI